MRLSGEIVLGEVVWMGIIQGSCMGMVANWVVYGICAQCRLVDACCGCKYKLEVSINGW